MQCSIPPVLTHVAAGSPHASLQKAFPPTPEDIEFWRNAKREDFNMSWEEVEDLLKEFEGKQ